MTPLESLRAALVAGAGRLRFAGGFRHVLGKGRSCRPHLHQTIEVVFHPTGRGSTRLADGSTVEFGPGALVLYPPHQIHDQAMSEPGVDLCLHIDLPGAERLAAGLLVPAVADPRLRRDCEDLAGAHVVDDDLRRIELDHRAAAFLCGVAARPPDEGDHAARARDLIARDYAAIRRVDAVAERLGIGGDHLRHLFTAAYGMGPGAWLLAVRVDRARDLLARSSLPLTDIAEACGFRSLHHLGAAFRRATGTSPMRWRRRHAPIRPRHEPAPGGGTPIGT